MKTTLKIAAIALILCATLMSGCIDDAADSIIDKAIDTAIEKATANALYAVTFDGGQLANPTPLSVMICKDGHVIINNDGAMSSGEYDRIVDANHHSVYKITYGDDNELRITLKGRNVASAYIYSDGFTERGEEFKGVWMDVSGVEPESLADALGVPTTEDIIYRAEVVLDQKIPGEMVVELYVDETATIVTTTRFGEVVESGTWVRYRKSPDHSLYDIVTDDGTELRLMIGDYKQQAVVYMYYDEFTRWDISHYGTWAQFNEDPTEKPIATPTKRPNPDNLGRPSEEEITLHFDAMDISTVHGDPYIYKIVMDPDGTLEICADITERTDDCRPGTWRAHGTASQYDIFVDNFLDIRICIIPDGVCRFTFDGDETILGEWERS